jgi:hypothetical protein
MPLDIFVYDHSLVALPSSFIELLETDRWGVKIDIQMSKSVGPGVYGATLASPAPARPVVVWVDDKSGSFAPTSLGELHGTQPATLPVTLYPLPSPVAAGSPGSPPGESGNADGGDLGDASGGGGGSPKPSIGPASGGGASAQSLDEAFSFIERQVQGNVFSRAHADGVRSLVDAVQRAAALPDPGPELLQKIGRWRQQLRAFGIVLSDASARLRNAVEAEDDLVRSPAHNATAVREENIAAGWRDAQQPVSWAGQTNSAQGRTIEVPETGEVPVVAKEARVVEEVTIGKQATETVRDTVRRTDVDLDEDGITDDADARTQARRFEATH